MKPRRPGRPLRAGKKPSDRRLEIRLTEQEHARWSRQAERRGMTLSDYVRACVDVDNG